MEPNHKQHHRNKAYIGIIGAALVLSMILVIYFNIRLNTEIVYTHFFYLPIILSAIWFHRKGILVAAFLGIMHISASYITTGMISYTTIIRAAMFLAVAIIVGYISEKKDQFYQELNISIKQNNLILQTISEGICQTDLQGNVTYANLWAIKIIGCFAEDISSGRVNLISLLSKPDSTDDQQQHPLLSTLRSGVPGTAIGILQDSVGKNIIIDYNCAPILEQEQVTGAVVAIRDITERVKVENEMERLDKLSLAGKMAASVAHELRNPMTTVRGFLQMYIDKVESLNKEHLVLMLEELDRANSIIAEFLSLGKKHIANPKLQNLNMIIKAVSQLIEAGAMTYGKKVKINYGEIPMLLLDDGEIRQLIFNLVNNGLEATRSGGEVTISTYVDGEEVILAIQDQGQGMEQGVLERIGTPFFTTKETGTGLGLAICYSIAIRHQATITFNTDNSGTTVYVKFPI